MNYNIYIKLTNGCNLQCKHCFNEIMGNHNSMSFETLDKIIYWLKCFRNEHSEDILNMSLHGGEPMLYNLDKISYLLDLTNNLNLKWCVTTNLIYDLTDKHLDIFNKMKPFDDNPMIMTSYDYGDLRFNNENNRQLWLKNVKKLLNNNINVQPIICLSKYLIENIEPEQIFNFLKSLNIKRFNFERITNTGRAMQNNIKPLNKDVDMWLLKAYKLYQKNDLICPLFQGVEQSLKRVFIGCRARECMKNVITINPDGSISSCPNMANDIYGNLDYIDNNKKQCLINFEKNINQKCLFCKYYHQCNGDCCQLTWDDSGCPGLFNLYEYLNN